MIMDSHTEDMMRTYPYEYYRGLLSPDAADVYDTVVHALSVNQMEFSVPHHLDKQECHMVTKGVMYDHPELFNCNYYAYQRLVSMIWERWIYKPFYSEEEYARLRQDAENWRRRILAQIPAKASRTEQIWLLYDYVARQVHYRDVNNQHSHTIVGCFSPNNHYVVCEGVAKGLKFLCDGQHIPCIVATGEMGDRRDSGPHAWNIVELENGHTYHLDATAQIRGAHLLGRANTRRFLYQDHEMKHYQWDRAELPKC